MVYSEFCNRFGALAKRTTFWKAIKKLNVGKVGGALLEEKVLTKKHL